ncbi:group II intron maturase-specific domain-containing protein [Vibrio aestuarianus]|uniref:group II intron maturase-specific domain-containing protein n=1 Tax=Vibrio aestuarianus TaxID=28171 RepID=UPI00237CD97D|nr:group II intron maturase-specific domain-containing protein [Vibrio aestuarianus]MDE1239215.1 hypothetical protein [Vibrio aestuarianus]
MYCKDSNRPLAYPIKAFTFLGFTFRPRKANNKEGKLFTSFLPAVSNEALSRLYNPILWGWFQYYGCFYPTQMRKLAVATCSYQKVAASDHLQTIPFLASA